MQIDSPQKDICAQKQYQESDNDKIVGAQKLLWRVHVLAGSHKCILESMDGLGHVEMGKFVLHSFSATYVLETTKQVPWSPELLKGAVSVNKSEAVMVCDSC